VVQSPQGWRHSFAFSQASVSNYPAALVLSGLGDDGGPSAYLPVQSLAANPNAPAPSLVADVVAANGSHLQLAPGTGLDGAWRGYWFSWACPPVTAAQVPSEVNVAPVLPVIGAQRVNELTLLTVTNTATESNIHSTLGYGLVNPPAGMGIDTNGIITWTPQQNQSPSTNLVTTVATSSNPYDPVNPHLSATNTFAVIVKEVNVAPVLPVIGTQSVNELALLTVTNTATESNIHSTLGYGLVNPPAGMSIDANGVITWTPQQNQSPSTNLVTTVATSSNPYDPVNPHLSATNTFTVIVKEVNVAPELDIGVIGAQPHLTWGAVSGWRYQVWATEALEKESWVSVGGVLTASGGTVEFTDSTTSGTNARFYRVQVLGPP
jgi:hypothetical protein